MEEGGREVMRCVCVREGEGGWLGGWLGVCGGVDEVDLARVME